MKKKLLIVSILLIPLLIWIFYCFLDYVNHDGTSNYNEVVYKNCIEESEYYATYPDKCDYIISNYNNPKKMTFDTMLIFYEITIKPNLQNLNLFIIVFAVAIALYYQNQLLKNKVVVNILNRTSHKNYIKKLLVESYKYAWLVPLVMLFLFILCFIYSGHFDSSYRNLFNVDDNFFYNMNIIVFMVEYMFSLALFNIFLINIGLIAMRKNHNLVVIIIESFLIYIGLDLVIEMFVGHFLSKIMNGNISPISLFNQFSLVYYNSVLQSIIVELGLVIVSTLIVYLMYKNKEKLIIDCEKNN